ncbi:glycosyltransferase [Phaeobacter sp. B1627]|uniref:glycosyltransferase n=1 Tax=Phaeobacter sp. B1627 TaxID=2583809 RepID=UPI00111B178B|nr:glycosyltransferase [Phaeobacter sp. B1627]TNJ40942.1 glycosyltransferase [Phaeobacter sp. B1627]
MKVALFNSLFPPLGIGGSEMSTYYLGKGLVDLGHSVQVITENTQNTLERETIDGIDVVRLPNEDGFGPNIYDESIAIRIQKRGSHRLPPFEQRLNDAIEDFSPDIMHTNVIGRLREIWKYGNKRRIPVAHTLRSYSMICSHRMLRASHPCIRQCRDCTAPKGRRNARDSSSQIQAIIGISNHILKTYREAGWFADVGSAHVIANSYDADPEMAAKIGNAPQREFDFGYIGRLHRTKGIEEFLDAVKRQQEKTGRRLKVLVAGTGNPAYDHYLKTRFKDLDASFPGYIDRSEFFSKVRFCVVPSIWYEPFGRIYVESLAYGVPVLASKRGGGAEVISDSCGYLFDPGQPQEIMGALAWGAALDDAQYADLRQNALEQAKLYSSEIIAKQYLQVYDTMLKNAQNEVEKT